MATDHGQHSNDERNPSVVFDKSDLGARGILIFFLVLAIFAVCANLVVLGLYAGMTKFAEKHEHETSPLAPKTVTPRAGVLANTADVNIRRFPEPRLLDDDTAPLKNFELKESAALTASSWQDAQGNTHPPIDDAMKAVVNNLPVRAGSSALTNYPGAGEQYSYPAAPDADAVQQEMGVPLKSGNYGSCADYFAVKRRAAADRSSFAVKQDGDMQ